MDFPVRDSLEALGLLAGAFLILAALGTLVGTPWTVRGGGAGIAVATIVGALAAVAIGAGLAWLVRTGR